MAKVSCAELLAIFTRLCTRVAGKTMRTRDLERIFLVMAGLDKAHLFEEKCRVREKLHIRMEVCKRELL
jgi:hypothetical protein